MGNQLTAIAPSQILPVEQYLSDVPNVQFVSSLGSTRFFKVAKALSKEGLIVIKVFVVHDPSLQLKGYKVQIEEMRNSLNWALNCIPFQSIIQTDKAVMLCRQYMHHSLYDRISTRPFLTLVEKKWIAFLLLSALDQCHKLNIFHGDIKSENLLITAWSWVLLTDFANFKPIFLPDNNPADFSYYFDTSRRRTCYIAPERFIETALRPGISDNLMDIADEPTKNGELNAAMDVFSAGCVIIELFTEGSMPFDLSQLLAYRSGNYFPSKLIESIEDQGIRELVAHMIQKDPSRRLEVEKYLINHKIKTFPESFYIFLKPYCQRFACSPSLNADERVTRIDRDFSLITQKIIRSTGTDEERSGSFSIILPIITSCTRKLQLKQSKLLALNLLSNFSCYVSADVVLDRIIPHILDFVNDKFVAVRCEMLRVLRFCISKINSLPGCDSNIFTEYIFPLISPLATDNETRVRMTFAENVAAFAEHAVRFLEIIQLNNSNDNQTEQNENTKTGTENPDDTVCKQSSFDLELQALQEFIQQKVVHLLGDRENSVKRTLLENGIEKLCIFFGRHKANDILFSHMITFLNDKHDWTLRFSFFDNVVGVATYLGWQCSSILKPLLQQGLADSEESAIIEALSSLSTFVELGLLQKNVVIDLIKEVLPLSFHPNAFIRQRVAGFVTKLSKRMHVADLHCYLLPQLSNFTTHPITSISNPMVLYSSFTQPLPRQIYQQLAKSPTPLGPFLAFLGKSSSSVRGIETSEANATLMRKLASQGMTEVDGVKIMVMADHLLNLHRSRAAEYATMNGTNHEEGMERSNSTLDLADLTDEETRCQGINICKQYDYNSPDGNSSFDTITSSRGRPMNKRFKNTDQSMNEDWKHMFGPEITSGNRTMSSETIRQADESANNQTPATTAQPEPVKKQMQEFLPRSVVARCMIDLEELKAKNREQYLKERALTEGLDSTDWKEKTLTREWKPAGVMVAHLHEHRGAVNRLRASSDHMYFASCSNDGCVKVWDTSRLDGKSITNRSRMTYSKQPGQLKTLCFCDRSQSLASASDTGSVHLFRIDSVQSKGEPLSARDFDPVRDGLVVDMAPFDAGSENIIAFATVHGSLFGWDTRSPGGFAWKIEMDQKHGLITTFDVHKQLGWIAAGTSTGAHVCWDMRFLLPVNTVSHPNAARVRRLVIDQNARSTVVSATQCNNELTFYDLETSTRQRTLWASPVPLLTYDQCTKHYYGGVHVGSNFVLTAGSDMRIRYWDLEVPMDSYIVVGAANDYPNINSRVSHNSRLIEATVVHYETYEQVRISAESKEEAACAYFGNTSIGHRDTVTDLVACISSQRYIVTSSRDGIIKVWK